MNLKVETGLHNGKYVLDTQMGKGVFGVTYRATNTESGRKVILKTLADNLCQHSDFERFKRRFFELAARLSSCKHANLVQVIDGFEDQGRPYVVMEYIPGQNLAQLIQSNVLPEAKAIEYIRQVGNALKVLHQAELLHQDIKPQNIILRQNTDCVVLCEFGFTCEFTPGAMQTHANLCCAGYAPLEQYSSQGQRTPATDVYALAATFYCLLTGHPPLPTPVRQALYYRGVAGSVSPDWEECTRTLSLALKQAVYSGLEILPNQRPQTIEAWLSLLDKDEEKSYSQRTLTQCLVKQPSNLNSVPAKLKIFQKKRQIGQLFRGEKQSKTDKKPSEGLLSKPKTEKASPTHQDSIGAKEAEVADFSLFPNLRRFANFSRQRTGKSASSSRLASSARLLKISFLTQQLPKQVPFPALLITGVLAASAGMGFGLALRLHASEQEGSTLLHTKQSFPASSNWPASESQL